MTSRETHCAICSHSSVCTLIHSEKTEDEAGPLVSIDMFSTLRDNQIVIKRYEYLIEGAVSVCSTFSSHSTEKRLLESPTVSLFFISNLRTVPPIFEYGIHILFQHLQSN